MSTASDSPHRYLDRFERFARDTTASTPPWLAVLRKDAIARFVDAGFPTRKLEDWRYTNVSAIAERPFELATDGAAGVSRGDVERVSFPVYACSLFVFVNGRFAPQLSAPSARPGNAYVESLAGALERWPARVEPHLARIAPVGATPFVSLNTAFVRDGAFIHLPEGAIVEAPIHVVYLSLAGDGPLVSHPRTLIVAGADSRATVIEDYVSVGAGASFTNAVTEVRVGAGAQLDFVRLQREDEEAFQIASLHAVQDRDSRFTAHSFCLGGAIVRNDIVAALQGEGADCTLDGLYVASGGAHVDNHTVIDHAQPRGTSRELYKGILGGSAKGVFHGKVIVREGAQHTDARQTNRNLLLSRHAEVDSTPTLEIAADDVKCSHGSTIGQLDDAQLFYLQARGIDATAARRLLMRAFASEVTARIRQEPLRGEIEELLLGRIEREQAA